MPHVVGLSFADRCGGSDLQARIVGEQKGSLASRSDRGIEGVFWRNPRSRLRCLRQVCCEGRRLVRTLWWIKRLSFASEVTVSARVSVLSRWAGRHTRVPGTSGLWDGSCATVRRTTADTACSRPSPRDFGGQGGEEERVTKAYLAACVSGWVGSKSNQRAKWGLAGWAVGFFDSALGRAECDDER